MEENESCSSRPVDSLPIRPWQQRRKLDVFYEVLRRLKESNIEEANSSGFNNELWAHFNRLPDGYAMDVDLEKAEDVLTHKRLLHLAQDPANRPAFEVRLVQVHPFSDEISVDSVHSNSPRKECAQSSNYPSRQSIHQQPAYGSSPKFDALALKDDKPHVQDEDSTKNSISHYAAPMHEITFSTDDKPKLLNQLSLLLGEIGLNIQEAHAFSTVDGYSLDVFVVDGWPYKETEQLRKELLKEISKLENQSQWNSRSVSIDEHGKTVIGPSPDHVKIPTDGTDDWEINVSLLKFEDKVASGSCGDLYKGTYSSQEVAIKVLNLESLTTDMQREFSQEVFILRKVRHRNIVQFIGACTKPPHPCIVTEFMSGGSVYDLLHKKEGGFKLPFLLKVAIGVSKGMNYLHQNYIIHRDLKTANLLMDENEVVKVADFGVSRVLARFGDMTKETGTYRWMAPEVLEHKPYDHKADIFSFGIILWELLTGEIPHANLTPIQAAFGVLQKGLRPTIPEDTHPKLVKLLKTCWQQDPSLRPDFSEIVEILQKIAKEVGNAGGDRNKKKLTRKILSALRRVGAPPRK